VVDNYPATFRGVVGGVPMAGGLGPVGQRVLDMLWNSVTKVTDDDDELNDREKQEVVCDKMSEEFVGREKLLANLIQNIDSCDEGIVHLSGVPGSGATSLLSKAYKAIAQQKKSNLRLHGHKILVPCFVEAMAEAGEDGNDETKMLIYIFEELMRCLGLAGSATDTENLISRNKRYNLSCFNLPLLSLNVTLNSSYCTNSTNCYVTNSLFVQLMSLSCIVHSF